MFGAVLSMMSLGCVMAAAPRSIQHCVSELFGGSFLSLPFQHWKFRSLAMTRHGDAKCKLHSDVGHDKAVVTICNTFSLRHLS